ncbi:MAG: hypothetical protein CL678_11410 [Bdellovibrionaceae bacterium]|nr:hypothetical protein [Pseudobdellovibrionaceae bacterium]|tara:strand:+ start:471 stop:1226 length:756 start_codon:yes stop_codon:yes gene_type:complete
MWSRVLFWIQFFILGGFLSLPYFIFIAIWGDWTTWPVGFLLGFGFLILVSVFSETFLKQIFHIAVGEHLGLKESYDRVLQTRFGKVIRADHRNYPEVLFIYDAVPLAYVMKSFRSNGTLVLSRGLVQLLTEKEFRALLHYGVLQARQPQILLKTIGASLSFFLFKLIPKNWRRIFVEKKSVKSLDLHPLGGFVFLPIYALKKWVDFWTGGSSIPIEDQTLKETYLKIKKKASVFPIEIYPAMSQLSFPKKT